jgi:hypothetical protein
VFSITKLNGIHHESGCVVGSFSSKNRSWKSNL